MPTNKGLSLHIGLNRVDPAHYGGWDGQLAACEFDAKDMQALAKAQGFTSQLLLTPPQDKLPGRVDLRPFMSPVENQQQIGSCTAQAVIGLLEYLQIATRGEYVDASRLFLYKATRNLLQWKGDTGAYIRDTIKAVRLFGVCPERYWNYDTERYDVEPDQFCYAFAGNYKALSYYRLFDLTQIKQSLAQGYPVAFGFTCFQSLFLEEVGKTGVIPYPLKKERAEGGHAILAVGYIDPKSGGGKNPKDPGYLIIRNSWGDWGRVGYGFLPYTFIHGNHMGTPALSEDYWTMTRMEIPELSDSQAAPFALARPDSGEDEHPDSGGVRPD